MGLSCFGKQHNSKVSKIISTDYRADYFFIFVETDGLGVTSCLIAR